MLLIPYTFAVFPGPRAGFQKLNEDGGAFGGFGGEEDFEQFKAAPPPPTGPAGQIQPLSPPPPPPSTSSGPSENGPLARLVMSNGDHARMMVRVHVNAVAGRSSAPT